MVTVCVRHTASRHLAGTGQADRLRGLMPRVAQQLRRALTIQPRRFSRKGEFLTPTISVVTAVFNRVDTVAEALASVHAQTWRPVEHIVIDGASTDGTVGVLQAEQARTSPSAGWRSDSPSSSGRRSRERSGGEGCARGALLRHRARMRLFLGRCSTSASPRTSSTGGHIHPEPAALRDGDDDGRTGLTCGGE